MGAGHGYILEEINVNTSVNISTQRTHIQSVKYSQIIPWAILGAIFLLINIYVYGSWIGGEHFQTVHTGSDAPPQWMYLFARFIEIFTPLCFLFVCYEFVYQPWRRSGELSGDGLMVIALITMNWQNTLPNYFIHTIYLNSVFTNWGSWYAYTPGWLSPNMQNLPEAPLAWGLCYACWFVFFPMILGAKAMRWAKQRFPNMGPVQLFLWFWLAFCCVYFPLEATFLRTGLYAYAGVIQSLAIWGGETYQYPIYELIGWALCWNIWATMYFYRDDKGLTWVERGVDHMKISQVGKKLLRLLALIGIFNLVFLVFANIPVALGGLNADPMPAGYPSYLSNNICGSGTDFACPDPALPIPRQTTPLIP